MLTCQAILKSRQVCKMRIPNLRPSVLICAAPQKWFQVSININDNL